MKFNTGVVHEDGVIEEDLEIPDDPPVIRNTSLHFTEDHDTQDTEDRRTQSPHSVQVLITRNSRRFAPFFLGF